MDLSFQNETQISKIFRSKKLEPQGLLDFREFVTEDSDAVEAQIRKISDQMRVIRMKRLLANRLLRWF